MGRWPRTSAQELRLESRGEGALESSVWMLPVGSVSAQDFLEEQTPPEQTFQSPVEVLEAAGWILSLGREGG